MFTHIERNWRGDRRRIRESIRYRATEKLLPAYKPTVYFFSERRLSGGGGGLASLNFQVTKWGRLSLKERSPISAARGMGHCPRYHLPRKRKTAMVFFNCRTRSSSPPRKSYPVRRFVLGRESHFTTNIIPLTIDDSTNLSLSLSTWKIRGRARGGGIIHADI